MVERLVPQPGVEVIVDERRYQIMQVLDLERVLIRDVATGEAKSVGLAERVRLFLYDAWRPIFPLLCPSL